MTKIRQDFDRVKNGCPWIKIEDKDNFINTICQVNGHDCWFKGCAVLYWLRNLGFIVGEAE